jgi:hypothetical protein
MCVSSIKVVNNKDKVLEFKWGKCMVLE